MSLARVPRLRGATSVVRDVVAVSRQRNVAFMAGSIAYSAFVSMLPLLLLALLVASAVGDQALATYLLVNTGAYLTPTGQELLLDAIFRAGARAELSVVGVAVLVWGVLKVFRGLDTAFSTLYESSRDNDLADQLRDGLLVTGAVSLAAAAMVLASAAFAFFPEVPYVGLLNPLLLVVGLTVAFFPIYYVYPDRDLAPLDVLPGTVVAALGWSLLQAAFQVYVRISSTAELYGVIGGVLLIVTWLYFASFVLLLGATVNVVLAGHHEPDAQWSAPA